MTKILIIEDEAKLAKLLANDLRREGFAVEVAADGVLGYERALEPGWGVILLDVMLPRMDGYEICRRLRSEGVKTPILMLTARGQETDKVVGLQTGADDYVTKPFGILELIARIRALLRRTGADWQLPSYECAPWRIDFVRQEAYKGKTRLELTTKEFQLLQYLVGHPREVISREQFLKDLWEYEAMPTTRTVDNQIASLRRKLSWDENSRGPKIVTVHNAGYRFTE
jgi:DNA-binding response OmpR family regulator